MRKVSAQGLMIQGSKTITKQAPAINESLPASVLSNTDIPRKLSNNCSILQDAGLEVVLTALLLLHKSESEQDALKKLLRESVNTTLQVTKRTLTLIARLAFDNLKVL